MMVCLRRISLCLLVFGACSGNNQNGTKAYTEACTEDAQCRSGHCLQASDGSSFCSRTCAADADCASQSTLYCCELTGSEGLCTSPLATQCRTPGFGDDCLGEADPFCARGGFACVDVSGRNICTFDCTGDEECAEVPGSACSEIGARKVCVTPDLNNLTRLESDCLVDSDCGGGALCQVTLDNDIDPFGWVTRCSPEALGVKALGAACTAGEECDHGLCYRNICTALCLNDSHCGPARICQPVSLGFDNPTQQVSSASVLAFCAPQLGSFRPCDSNASSCPSGEICSWELRYDVSSSNVCLTPEPLDSGAQALSPTAAGPGEACTGYDDKGQLSNFIDGKVKLCASGFCASELHYCVTPCRSDVDCASAQSEPMACVFDAFFSHCERAGMRQKGGGNGADCSGTSMSAANATCASGYCDLNIGKCAARLEPGAACASSAQCKSGRCSESTCLKPCRADTECAANEACEAKRDVYDAYETPTFSADDAIDTPTFCARIFATDPRVSCPENTCPVGAVCRPVLSADGSYRGLCSTATGAEHGAACQQDQDCKSGMCGGFDVNRYCLSLCIDTSDCAAGMTCIPAKRSRQAADKICAKPLGTAAVGAECASAAECASSLCVDGKCASLCTRGDAFGATCVAGGECARLAFNVDARLTPQLYDDRMSFFDACVGGAVAWSNSGNFDVCPSPKRFVFRPRGGALVGSCQSKLESSLDDGAPCQASTQCASGLCSDRVCRAPCTTTPSDTCGSGLKCDLGARALLGDDNGVTASAQACRPPCAADAECPRGSKCEPAGSADRFCRVSCAADADCSFGQSCSADLGGGLRLCE